MVDYIEQGSLHDIESILRLHDNDAVFGKKRFDACKKTVELVDIGDGVVGDHDISAAMLARDGCSQIGAKEFWKRKVCRLRLPLALSLRLDRRRGLLRRALGPAGGVNHRLTRCRQRSGLGLTSPRSESALIKRAKCSCKPVIFTEISEVAILEFAVDHGCKLEVSAVFALPDIRCGHFMHGTAVADIRRGQR